MASGACPRADPGGHKREKAWLEYKKLENEHHKVLRDAPSTSESNTNHSPAPAFLPHGGGSYESSLSCSAKPTSSKDHITSMSRTAPKRLSYPDNTLLVGTTVYYVDDLNTNKTYGSVDKNEVDLLDEALHCFDTDPARAKDLCMAFVLNMKPKFLHPKNNNKNNFKKDTSALSRRKARKHEYQQLQAVYKKNRSTAAKRIFKETLVSSEVTACNMFTYWARLLTRTGYNAPTTFTPYPERYDGGDIVDFVTPEEVIEARIPYRSAPGPDHFHSERESSGGTPQSSIPSAFRPSC